MRYSKSILASLTALAVTLAANPAEASSTTSASLSDYKYQLYSVGANPADMWLTFDNVSYNVSAATSTTTSASANGLSDVSAVTSNAFGSASAKVTNANLPSVLFTTQGTVSSIPNGDRGDYLSSAAGTLDFNLSPNTVVKFSTTSTLSTYVSNQSNEWAYAQTSFEAQSIDTNAGDMSQNSYNKASIYSGVKNDSSNLFSTEHANSPTKVSTLFASFANFTNNSIRGRLTEFVQSSGVVRVTPVPEPESWGMLLAGMCLMITLIGRRKI